MSKIQVNVTTRVRSEGIRRETYNGREHLVVSSKTLPENVVMNRILYPKSEIDAHYRGLEGTLAPLGHPTVNGQHVSAFSPEGINQGHIGAWNRNVKKEGNRISIEKWIDIEVANRSPGGKDLIQKIEAIESGSADVEPIHTSVALFIDRMEANADQKAQGIDYIAKIEAMDHDAVLTAGIPGAATPAQGVGMMVNADEASVIQPNSSVTMGNSYRERDARLSAAVKLKFPDEEYVWLADFTDTHLVIQRSGGLTEEREYTDAGGVITIGDTSQPVARKESWTTMVANSIKALFTTNRQAPPETLKEDDMSFTPQERADLLKDVGDAVAAQLKPLNDGMAELKANYQQVSDKLTANERAAEADMRAEVAKVHGDLIANSLSGEALVAMHKSIGTGATLAPNSASTAKKAGAPDPATYAGVK